MKAIIKVWFEDKHLCGSDADGKYYKQSLLWYPRLLNATDKARGEYEIGLSGIHWRGLDEDVSFESFEYPDAEPTVLQRFFLTHPEINISSFAQRFGIDSTLLHKYIKGFLQPSKDTETEILCCIRSLGIQ